MQLDDATLFWLTDRPSMTASAASTALVPSIARVKVCRILGTTPLRYRFYVSASQYAQLVDDVRQNGRVALTFSDVLSFRTLQYKGNDARLVTLDDDDARAMAAYMRRFGEALQVLRFSTEYAPAFFDSLPDEVAIEFTASDGFKQTPGADAGVKL